jgi:hypothetical protein
MQIIVDGTQSVSFTRAHCPRTLPAIIAAIKRCKDWHVTAELVCDDEELRECAMFWAQRNGIRITSGKTGINERQMQ